MLVISMGVLCNFTFAQVNYTLKGKVVDENNRELIGATVVLNPLKKGAITDGSGSFLFNNLSKGTYYPEISFVGYKPIVDTIFIDKNTTVEYQMEICMLSLQEVVVSDDLAETRKKEESLNIEIVNDDYLKQNLGGSLMNSLERLPGVSTIDIGSGQSKPVIRGLGFNRVLIVENNIKHESQQWGADHGLEIDQYAVDNIEVIKGPASLMYGSDAIGGVIDMKNRKIPEKNTFGGIVDLPAKTNNDLLGSSVSLYARKAWFYASLRVTILDYGDYKVPTDSVDIYSYRAALHDNYLRNTAGKEQNIHGTFGIIQKHFQSKFFVSSINNETGFFANAHGLEPRNIDADLYDKSNRDILYPKQNVSHFKVVNSSYCQYRNIKFEFDFGYQRNYRQEWSEYVQHGYMPATFADTLNFDADLERQFEKDVYSGNFKIHYDLSDKTLLKIGISGERQENEISGRGFIIPAYKQLNVGSFLLAKHHISDKSRVQAGLRYDIGNIKTSGYTDWYPSPNIIGTDTVMQFLQRAGAVNRNFSNLTWSLGYNYNSEKWMYKVNLGKSFRMPIAKELAANGVNYHRFSYEVGDADLSPEISYQLDAGVEFKSSKFAIGTTPFFNYFTNYIYLNPTAEHNRLYGNGNQVFYYAQSEVLRYGAELHAHYELLKPLQIGLIGEYVYSEQMSGEKKGFTLPFSPPLSGIINVKYQKNKFYFIENAYASVDYRVVAAQNNIVPPEETTPGYQVINIGMGGYVSIKNQKINISMQVQNLFNKKYFNHTSYYRLINVPESGRNFIINISIPFSGEFKNK